MAKQPKMLPHFESEQEEIEFWDTHDFEDYLEGPGDLIIRIKKRPTKMITMRFDEALYHELRAFADEHKVPYQRLIQEFAREGLRALVAKERGKARGGARVTSQPAPATTP